MSLDFYPAQSGRFPNPFNDHIATVKADEPAEDYIDMVSFNQASAAKLIPLLALPVEDGYGEIAAADLYQRCHAVLLRDRAVIAEFTCANSNSKFQLADMIFPHCGTRLMGFRFDHNLRQTKNQGF